MKKKLLIFLMIAVMALFTACNIADDTKDLLLFSEGNEQLQEAIDQFTSKATELMASQPSTVQNTFNADIAMFSLQQTSEAMYYTIIMLHNSKLLKLNDYSEMQNLNITKNNNTYTLTYKDDGKNHEVIIKSSENSSSIVSNIDNKFTYLVEKAKLGNNEFAMQYCAPNEGEYYYGQLYINGNTGRMAVHNKVATKPASIYNVKSVPSAFATGGDKSYNVTATQFTYNIADNSGGNTGGGDNNGDGNNYTVSFMTNGGSSVSSVTAQQINSSPSTTKTDYVFVGWYTNSEFSGAPIQFPYTITANVTFYAKWAPVETTFTATFNSKGGSAVSTITIDVIVVSPTTTKDGFIFGGWYLNTDCEGSAVNFPYTLTQNTTFFAKWTAEIVYPDIINTTLEFYNNINSLDGFCWGNNYILEAPQKALDYFNYTVLQALSTQWAAPVILYESINAIKAQIDGNFSTLHPAMDLDGVTYTPSVVYDAQDNSYMVKVWLPKYYHMHWFEVLVKFDDATQSLTATIKAGIGSMQLTRDVIEYKKLSDGTFIGWVLTPEVYEVIDSPKNAFHFSVKGLDGIVVEYRLMPNDYLPNSLYQSQITEFEYDSYDRYFSVTDGEVVYNDNLVCNITEYIDNYLTIESNFFEAIEDNNNVYEFDYYRGHFSFAEVCWFFDEALEYIRKYNEKVYYIDEENRTISVSLATNKYTVMAYNVEEDYIEYTVEISLVKGKLKMYYIYEEDNGYTCEYTVEILPLTGNGFAMQIYHQQNEYYDDIPGSTYKELTQTLILDNDNGRLLHDRDYSGTFNSILTIGMFNQSLFATMAASHNFDYINGVLTEN